MKTTNKFGSGRLRMLVPFGIYSGVFEVIWHTPYDSVLKGDKMPFYKWFKGGSLNYSEHIFRNFSSKETAYITTNEAGETIHHSWKKLEQEVTALQYCLIKNGIKKGDRIAGYLPNTSEALVAFLAVNSMGAVWSCCSPDFGVNTVVERFEQIEPRILIVSNGYRYNNKPFDRNSECIELAERLPSVEKTIEVNHLNTSINKDFEDWNTIIKNTETNHKLYFEPVEFEHPIWVLYSSGTTGKPKAITHSHGGCLLEHLKYTSFQNDVKKGENYFWFTTTGWMMWNFLQSTLLAGAVPVFYDGNPNFPDPHKLWQLAEKLPINHFGTSAPYLMYLKDKNIQPNSHDLSQLRSISSTGSPLPADIFEFVYNNIKNDIWLTSMSGGTDVCTAFVGGVPSQPVYSGLIQGRALGCALYAYNEKGEAEYNKIGEMVIDQPMPSMPIYFWKDEEKKRYKSSYFEEYEAKWCHGDYIWINPQKGIEIHGRSDATLNRKGIRIGTAEVYAILSEITELEDSLIINIEQKGGTDFMPLFVQLKNNTTLTKELEQKIKQLLKSEGSPRHVPDIVVEVQEIPYTLSGKKMEVPVKKLLMGKNISAVLNKEAMRNPESMDNFLTFYKNHKQV